MTNHAGLLFAKRVTEPPPLSAIDLVLYELLSGLFPKFFVWYRVLPLNAKDVSQASVYESL
jgi:hypothetical protein